MDVFIIRILEALMIYMLVIFVFSRLFVPHLGFRKEPLPRVIPKSMEKEIGRLKKRYKSPLDFAKAAYDVISRKYEGSHIFAYYRWDLVFSRNLGKLWSRKGYLPCNQQNLIYRVFLVKSGLLSDDQIRLRHTPIYAMVHQYVQISCKGNWIDVDLWASQCGIPFGKRANLFTIAFIEKHLYGRAKVIYTRR